METYAFSTFQREIGKPVTFPIEVIHSSSLSEYIPKYLNDYLRVPTIAAITLVPFFKRLIKKSTRQLGENTVEVQDDFELLCWDFVSTPSNPGSYMREKGMMNESKLPTELNKYKNVNSIITDILCANGTCPIF